MAKKFPQRRSHFTPTFDDYVLTAIYVADRGPLPIEVVTEGMLQKHIMKVYYGKLAFGLPVFKNVPLNPGNYTRAVDHVRQIFPEYYSPTYATPEYVRLLDRLNEINK